MEYPDDRKKGSPRAAAAPRASLREREDTMVDRNKFAAFVSARRREKGMTQRQLAEQLHVSDKAVSKWERGVSHS